MSHVIHAMDGNTNAHPQGRDGRPSFGCDLETGGNSDGFHRLFLRPSFGCDLETATRARVGRTHIDATQTSRNARYPRSRGPGKNLGIQGNFLGPLPALAWAGPLVEQPRTRSAPATRARVGRTDAGPGSQMPAPRYPRSRGPDPRDQHVRTIHHAPKECAGYRTLTGPGCPSYPGQTTGRGPPASQGTAHHAEA